MLGQVAGAADWHLNSDEPDVLDYDTSFKPPAQDALYEPNGYRSSDHDPVVVGLNLVNAAPTRRRRWAVHGARGRHGDGQRHRCRPRGLGLTFAWDLDNNGSFETSGQTRAVHAHEPRPRRCSPCGCR